VLERVHRWFPQVILWGACYAAVSLLQGCDTRVYPIRPGPPDAGSTACALAADLVGFASVSGSTSGGGSAPSVVVSELADLMMYAARTEAEVIFIDGMISVPSTEQPFQVPVASNKTIRGVDAMSGLVGGGFLVDGKQNVVFQNLVIALPTGTDAITVQYSNHVWIDHCELYSDTTHSTGFYGWLINAKHASDFLTVSWTLFHDHFNTFQVGHSDTNGAEDVGHLTVTSHHNSFARTNSGTPRVRFGSVHVFNNLYQNVGDYAVASQMAAQVIVEKNVFDTVALPITNEHDVSSTSTSIPGQIQDDGDNSYDSSGANQIVSQAGPFTFVPPYSYSADWAASVPVIVGACAGTGKI
jgi:pectate lyase